MVEKIFCIPYLIFTLAKSIEIYWIFFPVKKSWKGFWDFVQSEWNGISVDDLSESWSHSKYPHLGTDLCSQLSALGIPGFLVCVCQTADGGASVQYRGAAERCQRDLSGATRQRVSAAQDGVHSHFMSSWKFGLDCLKFEPEHDFIAVWLLHASFCLCLLVV